MSIVVALRSEADSPHARRSSSSIPELVLDLMPAISGGARGYLLSTIGLATNPVRRTALGEEFVAEDIGHERNNLIWLVNILPRRHCAEAVVYAVPNEFGLV